MAFTRDAESTLKRYVAGSSLESIAVSRTMSRTVRSLEAELALAVPVVSGFGADVLVNIPANSVEARVVSKSAFEQFRTQRAIQLPPSLRVIEVGAVTRKVANIYGGLPLDGSDLCTSGFGVVFTGTGDRRVTTAGHCANSLSYPGGTLVYQTEVVGGQTEVVGGSHDEQSHLAVGFQVQNRVTDCCGTRQITSRTSVAAQPVGGLVCKYGRTTGFACGYIDSKTVAPACVPSPTGTFVWVLGGSTDLAEPGDSGGPTYLDLSAYGGIICQAGNDMIYVAVDYIEVGLGVTILTSP